MSRRNRISPRLGQLIHALEDHFRDYVDDEERMAQIYLAGIAMRAAAGSKHTIRSVWKLVCAVSPEIPEEEIPC
jgi:hypothetical protein